MTPRTEDLPATSGFVDRIRSFVSGLPGMVQQFFTPLDVQVWGGGGSAQVGPSYPPLQSLSAMAGFPWVRACARAKVDDVGGLPLIATRGTGRRLEVMENHPFLTLIQRPSPGVTGTMFLRQLEADLCLTGNFFIWLRSFVSGYELHRLHPGLMEAITKGDRIVAWVYNGTVRIPASQVFHGADINWSDDLTSIFGESPIRALHDGLVGVRASRKHAALQANKGRPDVVISVDAPAGGNAAAAIGQGYEDNVASGRRAFVVTKGISVEKVTWSPKELESEDYNKTVRDEVLAVMRVPPTRAGVPQANYAVAKAELRDYWGSLVNADLRLLSDAFTEIAWAVGGPLDAWIRHDTSGVEALQSTYDQRQARAGFWVTVMGAEPAEAAAYEGFRDAPVGTLDEIAARKSAAIPENSRPAKEVDDQPNRQGWVWPDDEDPEATAK